MGRMWLWAASGTDTACRLSLICIQLLAFILCCYTAAAASNGWLSEVSQQG